MSSKKYFDTVSSQWDTMRTQFFNQSLKEQILTRITLNATHAVVDLGAGTGFWTESLVQHTEKIFAVDQSSEMQSAMRLKFNAYPSIKYICCDAYNLALESNSIDFVFANMFLHHISQPEIAIAEIFRILKPGGKLLLSDLCSHNYSWLQKEHHDVWKGFSKKDILTWLLKNNFRHINYELLNEDCSCCSPCNNDAIHIPIFFTFASKI